MSVKRGLAHRTDVVHDLVFAVEVENRTDRSVVDVDVVVDAIDEVDENWEIPKDNSASFSVDHHLKSLLEVEVIGVYDGKTLNFVWPHGIVGM